MNRIAAAAVAVAAVFAAANPGRAGDYVVSPGITHENLTIFFVRGASRGGRVPLTLDEALTTSKVRIYETGSVNELAIENFGGDEVFVQAGDIVKGGQQDRVLTVSLLLPPHSGRMAIGAFCVEQGRWSKRGTESAEWFGSSASSVPSREAKLAIRGAATAAPAAGDTAPARPQIGDSAARGEVAARQSRVWQEVGRVQRALSDTVGAPVQSPQSASSLQLALENDKLRRVQTSYLDALRLAGEKEGDIIGYVFAISGSMNSAEIYPWNALFRKMWPKLLSAAATEAISAKGHYGVATPTADEVAALLDAAEAGKPCTKTITPFVELEIRETERALYLESRGADRRWLHRSYLAK